MRGLVVAGVVGAGVGCSSTTTSIEQARVVRRSFEERLVWSALSKTVDPDGIRDLIGSYTHVVATELSRREAVATP